MDTRRPEAGRGHEAGRGTFSGTFSGEYEHGPVGPTGHRPGAPGRLKIQF